MNMKNFLDGMSLQDLVGSRPVWARAFFKSIVEDDLVTIATVSVSKINPPIGVDVQMVSIEMTEKRKKGGK